MKKTLKIFCFLSLALILCGCKDVKLNNGENAIVTFDDGGISAQDLYDSLKETYAQEKIVDIIDSYLLNKKYETSTEETKYVNNAVKTAKKQAEEYNTDFDTYVRNFYRVNGTEGFKKYISLNYKRTLWISDYAKETVTEKQIKDYYENETVGDMDLYHILITINDEVKDNDAYNKAKEVIEKLNDGEDFTKLVKEYSEDEATKDNEGSLGKINTGDYDDSVIDAAKKLEVNEYSKSPVKSTYGYHVILKKSQEEKPELNDETKTEIVEIIAKEIANDTSFYAKAMVALREKNNMKFIDTTLEEIYNDVVNLQ